MILTKTLPLARGSMGEALMASAVSLSQGGRAMVALPPASAAGIMRAGDTLHVAFADAEGFVWSYPSRVVWVAPGRLALTLPLEPRWRALLQPGARLTATLVDGQTVATAHLVVHGVSPDLPPLLLVGPPTAGRRSRVTTPLLPGELPQLPALGERQAPLNPRWP